MRARPQRIFIERGGRSGGETLRAELDSASPDVARALARLLDEAHPPTDDEPEDASYDLVLDYGDHEERLRYDDEELPADVRATLDARLEPGG
ncbi:MAG TPA: hypothetical protein VKB10_04230 [Gaiellaceae bacterium]|nr:hypothetical protein [Gaiellaceae bacterium]